MKLYNMVWWGIQCMGADWCKAYTECSSIIQWICRSHEQSLAKCAARYLRTLIQVTDNNNEVEAMKVICESIQTMLGEIWTFPLQHLWCSSAELDKYVRKLFRKFCDKPSYTIFLRRNRQWSRHVPCVMYKL